MITSLKQRRQNMAKKAKAEEQKQENWKRHIEESRRSGNSQAEYCRLHKLSTTSFAYWKRRFRQQSPVRFVPVQVKPETQIPADNSSALVLSKERYRIEIKEGNNPEVLEKVLQTLREL